MHTQPIVPDTLAQSVIAVPPLARRDDLTIDDEQNRRMIRHLEQGGVTTLLYGGNALLYHIAPSEYEGLLRTLEDSAGEETLVIPSVGPAYGMMMDQAAVLRDSSFPTAMILPQRDVCTFAGIARAVRQFVDRFESPAVLYIKHENFIDADTVRGLMADGLLSWIKYAIVRDDPREDTFLRELIDAVGPLSIVSGIGEQPAIAHLRDFGVSSFTSGCVCIAPALSMRMLRALQQGQFDEAEQIRSTFQPLEDLRNQINPVRVLHAAVTSCDIADMGPVLPLMSDIDDPQQVAAIREAAKELLQQEEAAAS